MLKFARDLTVLGWEVHVLCPLKTAERRQDPLMINQIPSSVKVYRVPMCDISGYQTDVRQKMSDVDPKKNTKRISLLRFMVALIKKIKWSLFYPDVHVTWYPFLFLYGSTLCLRNRYDAILATGDPWSVVLAGECLARMFSIPFVADFRELWSGHSQGTCRDQRLFARVLLSEQKIFAGARIVIGNSPSEREILEATCQVNPRPAFVDLENGFDSQEVVEAFKKVDVLQRNSVFSIAYAGSFNYRRPDAFFEALSNWLDDQPDLRSKVRVKIAGLVEQRVINLVTSMGLDDMVDFLGYLPYEQTLEILMRSDLLLAIVGTPKSRPSDPTVPAKLYEYVALGRPVLLMAKPGGASRFFEAVGGYGALVDNESPAEVRSALDRLYARYLKIDLPLICDLRVGEYTREAMAIRLSEQLKLISDQQQKRNNAISTCL